MSDQTIQVNDAHLETIVVKITKRLLPFLLLMYVLAFLDRANVGFAKKAFQTDTGLSDAVFAFGASAFFFFFFPDAVSSTGSSGRTSVM